MPGDSEEWREIVFFEEKFMKMVQLNYSFWDVLRHGLLMNKSSGLMASLWLGAIFVAIITATVCSLISLLGIYNYMKIFEVFTFPLIIAGLAGGLLLFLGSEYRGYLIIKKFADDIDMSYHLGRTPFSSESDEVRAMLKKLIIINLRG